MTLYTPGNPNQIDNLVQVDFNDDANPGCIYNEVASRIEFNATQGNTYYFQVGGYDEVNLGEIHFELYNSNNINPSGTSTPTPTPTPNNDYFSNAHTILLNDVVEISNLNDNTVEPNEPVMVQGKWEMKFTKWYNFTPSSDGWYEVNSCERNGLRLQTLLGVYTGSSLASLVTIGTNRAGCYVDSAEMWGSRIYFHGTAGTSYKIQLSKYDDTNTYNYSYTNPSQTAYLNVADAVEPTTPVNDNFADATAPIADVIRPANGVDQWNLTYTHGATSEPGEPDITSSSSNPGRGNIERTVWYKWTNGSTQKVMWLDTCVGGHGFDAPDSWSYENGGGNVDSLFDVYRPNNQTTPSINGLTRVATNDDWNTPDQTNHWGCMWADFTSFTYFTAEPNTTYYLRVGERGDTNQYVPRPMAFTFRTQPVEVPRVENTPSGDLICESPVGYPNNPMGGPKMSIPYELSQSGVSLDGWFDCWAWCQANMTPEAPICQYNGDGPRSCGIGWAPAIGGLDSCVWRQVTSSQPWPMGGYLGQTTGHIIHLPDGLGGTLVNQPGIDVTKDGQLGSRLVRLFEKNTLTNAPLADIMVDFSTDRDWTGIVTGATLPGFGKSFTHSLTSAPGASDNFDLYVPIPQGASSNSVNVCPGASSFDQVSNICDGLLTYVLGVDSNLSKVTIQGQEYWKITGVTGTGGQTIISDFYVYDTMSRQQQSMDSNHDIFFGSTYGVTTPGEAITLTFPSGFDLTNLVFGDISLLADGNPISLVNGSATDTAWGVDIQSGDRTVTFTAPNLSGYINMNAILEVKLINATVAPVKNPSTVGSYTITINIDNPSHGGPEDGTVEVPIVDSDQVDVVGYVDSYMDFDIDVANNASTNCSSTNCLIHSGGTFGTNYTVDLGELSWQNVNKSRDSVMHSDGHLGMINSIYFDLTSNAPSGVVVNVISANGALQGPGSSSIIAVTDGTDIISNSSRYGFNLPVMPALVHGSITLNPSCDTSSTYCGPSSSERKLVFNTNEHPVDQARVRMDIAASPSYTNNPGNYNDTLTFVATSTF